MRNVFIKKVSFITLIWTIILAMIYTGGGAVHSLTNIKIGIVHFAVAIMWAVIAVLSARAYAKSVKYEVADKSIEAEA